MEIISAVLMVLALILFKSGLSYWQMYRLKTCMDTAQHAMQMKDWREACRLLAKGVDMQPGAIPVRVLYAVALAQSSKLAEAEEQLRFAIDLEPKRPDTSFNLGFFLATKHDGRYEEAAAAFRTALRHDPALREMIEKSTDLAAFRGSAECAKLLEEYATAN